MFLLKGGNGLNKNGCRSRLHEKFEGTDRINVKPCEARYPKGSSSVKLIAIVTQVIPTGNKLAMQQLICLFSDGCFCLAFY